jgi:glycosyltransferase involved in cell wall biosynthesis
MRLLFVTQTMDRNDAVLGAYHGWVAALAPRFESIEVTCLYQGEHQLPANVRVHSLGKEKGRLPAIIYAIRFKLLAWKLRHQYDAVFVHMNQEYILIAGPMWKVLGKKIYFWRNHYAGSLVTDGAALFATKVFCTSRSSYTVKYQKTVLMPVGIDTTVFTPGNRPRESRSLLFLARMAPSKRPDLFIDALGLLIKKGTSFIASMYGSPTKDDARYYESLKHRAEELGLHSRVRFHPAIPNRLTPDVYRAHEIFVNCSPAGMFDKTIFEAAACGALPVSSSTDYPEELQALVVPEGDADALAVRIEELLSGRAREDLIRSLENFVKRNSLEALVNQLTSEII